MITSIHVYDANLLNSIELDEFPYPLNVSFKWDYPISGDTIQRPFSAGRHDTRQSVQFMTIDCEGEIVETTTTAYWTSRKALVECVLPTMVQPAGLYRHSQIRLVIDGDATVYTADVQLTSYSIPLTTDGAPTVSPFMFSWTCNLGYWTNSSTGDPVRL